MRVTVLGAGIVGLWTADLASRLGHTVTVRSRSFYESTTSAAAVCVLTPFFPGDPTTPVFGRSVEWARDTLEHVRSLDVDGVFLERLRCFEFGLDGMLEADFPVSKLDHLDFSTFEIIDLGRVIDDCNFAVGFDCHLCDTRVFLPWLHEQLLSRGVRFELARVDSLDEVAALPADLVFNCLGYQSLFPDAEMYAVRGQSMFIPVDGQPLPHFGLGAGHHAVFKHRRGFYIGSYFMHGIDSGIPREDLYERSRRFVRGPFQHLCASVGIAPPEIDMDAVQSVSAGLRPFRASGPRVETDSVGAMPVVHNYGHGAHGWTIGYASAVEAVRLGGLSGA
jgi:D-amino-acid oxidase